jgi:hypothetical protein
MLNTARWHDSDWRRLIAVWAYLLVIAGMWLTVSPWRLRDLLQWAVESPARLKKLSLGRLAFCALVIALGATVFR